MNKVIKELQTAIIKSCGNGRVALGKDANVMRELIQWKLAVRIPWSTQSEEGADNRISVYTQTVAVLFSHCRWVVPRLQRETAPGAGRWGMIWFLLLALLLPAR